jgi:hypothetical protein
MMRRIQVDVITFAVTDMAYKNSQMCDVLVTNQVFKSLKYEYMLLSVLLETFWKFTNLKLESY